VPRFEEIMDVKARILEKATDLFMRYGIRSITMDEIASQLGISKKTIYQFFTDKDELVEGVVDQEIQRNVMKCERFQHIAENAVHEIFVAAEEMAEMLKSMNPLIMYDLEKHHPKAHKKYRDHINQFMLRAIKDNLERGVAEDLFRADMVQDIVARHRIESAFMPFNQDVFPHSRYRVVEVCFELAMLYLHGITNPLGKKMIEKYSTERNKQLSHEHQV
jgi:AcrR family transcriptional regulator